MGPFSWRTSDKDESIWSYYSDNAMADNQKPNENNPVYIITPDDKEYEVIQYDGHGNFIFRLDNPLYFEYYKTCMWYAVKHTKEPYPIHWPKAKKGIYHYVVHAYILLYMQNYRWKKEANTMIEYGQELDLKKNKDKYSDLRFLKFASESGLNYFDLKASEHCPSQGYFYG